MFQAHRLLYHSTLGSRVIKKKKKVRAFEIDGLVLSFKGLGAGGEGRFVSQNGW